MVRPVYQQIGRPSNSAPDPKSGVRFMAAVGYSVRLLQAWLAVLLRLLLGNTRWNVARDANPRGLRALIASATQIADQNSARTTT